MVPEPRLRSPVQERQGRRTLQFVFRLRAEVLDHFRVVTGCGESLGLLDYE
jgi:hypothetical protein